MKRKWRARTSGASRWRAIAKFPLVRTLEGFELATCRWIGNGDALLLLGPPGVGKSHLAVARGREAIQHGYSTLFASATALVTALTKAHHTGRLEERLMHYANPKLLIVDELGYLPLEVNAAYLSFRLVSHRHERGSVQRYWRYPSDAMSTIRRMPNEHALIWHKFRDLVEERYCFS